jgi:hypothetical protein
MFVLLCVWRCLRLNLTLFSIGVWPDLTLRLNARQVALGWLKPYTVRHQWLGVANDVFNDVECVMSCPSTTPRTVNGMVPFCRVILHYSCVL